MKKLEKQYAELVEDMGVNGTHKLYMSKLDDKLHWFVVPNNVASGLPKKVKCELIMEYYEEDK